MEEQEIRSRLLNYAAKAWGFSDAAIENSFDPLVSLLLGASAHEIGKVYSEIHSTESRLLLKLTQLLTPDVITGATPAHAVMQAAPLDNNSFADESHQFYFQRKVDGGFGRDESEDIFFTPAGRFLLCAAKVRLQAAGNKLFAYKSALTKESLASAVEGNIPPNKVWIGVETDEQLKNIPSLTFFFEHRNPSEANSFYNDLAAARITCNGVELKAKQGVKSISKTPKTQHQKLIEAHYDITAQIEAHAHSYYNHQFITVDIPEGLDESSAHATPDFPHDVFPEQAFQKVTGKLVWFSFEIPGKSKTYNLSEVGCALNCFPAVNRKKEEFTYRVSDKHTIIALNSPGKFLDVIDVSAQDGTPYFETAISNPTQAEVGSYLLRHSGVGRFDKRNAMEMTEYVLQLLRDESASFSALGRDLIESQLKQVNQIIAAIEQRISSAKKSADDVITYLILNALRFPENIFVRYWHTDAERGNSVRPGTKLTPYQGNEFMRDDICLMTTSTGGRNALSPTESVQVYKNAVLTRQRIVTPKDIETACFMIAGNKLQSVSIQKGLAIEPGTDGNYIRCVEVKLMFAASLDAEAKMSISREVQTYLETHSSGMYPFKVHTN